MTVSINSKRKKRILAIDDEPAMVDWLKILLEHAGFEVKTALIGTRGEEIFKTWRPDAVITDMMLPDVDGIELVKRFKDTSPETEVIVISGQGTISRAVDAVRNGASYFLEKPVDQDAIAVRRRRRLVGPFETDAHDGFPWPRSQLETRHR